MTSEWLFSESSARRMASAASSDHGSEADARPQSSGSRTPVPAAPDPLLTPGAETIPFNSTPAPSLFRSDSTLACAALPMDTTKMRENVPQVVQVVAHL